MYNIIEVREMKEEILKLLPIMPYITMINWLYHRGVEHLHDFIDWYVTGQENEHYEIDIWIEDSFLMVRYDANGNYIRHEEEKR